MSRDTMMDAYEGPRKLRLFANLLLYLSIFSVVGVLLAEMYGFPWVERFTLYFLNNPELVLAISGVISVLILIFKVLRFFENQSYR